MPRYGRDQQQVNALAHQHKQDWQLGDGAKTEFFLAHTVLTADNLLVFVSGALKRPADQNNVRDYRIRGVHANTPISSGAYPGDSNAVTFTAAPGNNVSVCFVTMGG